MKPTDKSRNGHHAAQGRLRDALAHHDDRYGATPAKRPTRTEREVEID